MSESRTLYEVLGVSRTASAQEIRAAYLRLMKRHHPDTAPGTGSGADLVAVLNRCYAILKNPATRSQYDQGLQASAVTAIPSTRDQVVPTQLQPGWTAVLLASVVALGIFLLSLDSTMKRDTKALAARAGGWIASGTGSSAAPLRSAPTDTANTRRIAQLARTLPADQAEQFSRRCFAASAQHPQPGVVDSCVLFDVAFLYWQKVPGYPALPAYFADGVVDSRHREAMTEYGSAAEPRLLKVRQLAFRALMHSIEERRSKEERAPLPAITPELREIQDAERQRLAESGS